MSVESNSLVEQCIQQRSQEIAEKCFTERKPPIFDALEQFKKDYFFDLSLREAVLVKPLQDALIGVNDAHNS